MALPVIVIAKLVLYGSVKLKGYLADFSIWCDIFGLVKK
jgi:hypothetical protein